MSGLMRRQKSGRTLTGSGSGMGGGDDGAPGSNQPTATQHIPRPLDTDVITAAMPSQNADEVRNHLGNQLHGYLVSRNRAFFAGCAQGDQIRICQSIVSAVKAQGGRFLEWDRNASGGRGGWTEIGGGRAVAWTHTVLSGAVESMRAEEQASQQQQQQLAAVAGAAAGQQRKKKGFMTGLKDEQVDVEAIRQRRRYISKSGAAAAVLAAEDGHAMPPPQSRMQPGMPTPAQQQQQQKVREQRRSNSVPDGLSLGLQSAEATAKSRAALRGAGLAPTSGAAGPAGGPAMGSLGAAAAQSRAALQNTLLATVGPGPAAAAEGGGAQQLPPRDVFDDMAELVATGHSSLPSLPGDHGVAPAAAAATSGTLLPGVPDNLSDVVSDASMLDDLSSILTDESAAYLQAAMGKRKKGRFKSKAGSIASIRSSRSKKSTGAMSVVSDLSDRFGHMMAIDDNLSAVGSEFSAFEGMDEADVFRLEREMFSGGGGGDALNGGGAP